MTGRRRCWRRGEGRTGSSGLTELGTTVQLCSLCRGFHCCVGDVVSAGRGLATLQTVIHSVTACKRRYLTPPSMALYGSDFQMLSTLTCLWPRSPLILIYHLCLPGHTSTSLTDYSNLGGEPDYMYLPYQDMYCWMKSQHFNSKTHRNLNQARAQQAPARRKQSNRASSPKRFILNQ